MEMGSSFICLQARTVAHRKLYRALIVCVFLLRRGSVEATTVAESAAFVTCASSPSSCTTLDLSGSTLTGSIPTEIGLLTALVDLNLATNTLTNRVPSEVGVIAASMRHRRRCFDPCLTASHVRTFAALPPKQITQKNYSPSPATPPNQPLSSTGPLLMYYCCFPPHGLFLLSNVQMGLLLELTSLELKENQLACDIPTEMGRLTKLTLASLSNNLLTSSIPSELGLMTALSWLSLYGNLLTGSIPLEITVPSGYL
eukprot:1195761-Prorocentrum_minimum.AAC.7